MMKISFKHSNDDSAAITLIPLLKKQSTDSFYKKNKATLGKMLATQRADFRAGAGDVQIIYTEHGKVFLLGLGEHLTFGEAVKMARAFGIKQQDKLDKRVTVVLSHFKKSSEIATITDAVVNGLMQSTYQIERFHTDKKEAHPLARKKAQLTLVVDEKHTTTAENAARKGQISAEAQLSIIDLVNAPANKKTPQVLADWARQSGQKSGFSVTTFSKAEIVKMGLGGLLAINRGSEDAPEFIVMEYKPKTNKTLKRIGLVGKGVTFDVGGLSIKSSTNMHYMKSDMGGAAAVFGTMETVARLGLPIHLIGIVPSTDNSVDANSIKPSDVITTYSGKTIEIIDTDAEGRVILSDGLAYMVKHFQPDVLIDLATLTGSAVRALGYEAGALFSNNDKLASQLSQAGYRTGEKVWRMPIWDAYGDDMKSDVADIKNFSGKPVAGAITAAKFLQFFTEQHPNWAHLDIAGVAFGGTDFSMGKSATGFGVRLLTDLIENEYV
ncbi:MAG: leucyl aminopeptidase family protein [Bacteroidota bacterium]